MAAASKEAIVAAILCGFSFEMDGMTMQFSNVNEVISPSKSDARKIVARPGRNIECLALVRPNSAIALEWNLSKPAYCIYEYELSFDSHEIRWGDGSWQRLGPKDYESFILLPEFDEDAMAPIFNF